MLGELRKDYVLDRWVVLAPSRSKRPQLLALSQHVKNDDACFFCPGNEHLTPPEIGRIKNGSSWLLRWFENKFPALQPQGQPFVKTDNRFFKFSSNYGYHEVIVETPKNDVSLGELPAEHILLVLQTYCNRIKTLSALPHIKYVSVFKNHGGQAGASISHSHSQVMAVNTIPPFAAEQVAACRKFILCPYCQIVDVERRSLRRVIETEHMLAFTPYAPRFHYECWIFPKKHVRSLCDLSVVELLDMAKVLKSVLEKTSKVSSSYNLLVHESPCKEDTHLYIEIAPRNATWAGFELSTGTVITSVSPEDAAAFYRGET